MFLWHFKPIPLRKTFSQKICMRKKKTFKRSALLQFDSCGEEMYHKGIIFKPFPPKSST